jgi:ATP-dependent DNA ligase I
VLLRDLVETSAEVARSPGRKAKISAIAELLARVPPDEVRIAVAFLSGELTQRQIGVGYAALTDLSPQAQSSPGDAADSGSALSATPELTLTDTDATFEAIGAMLGPGSQAQRRAMLAGLIGRATESERNFLFRLIAGDLGQGALEGVMTEAVALAAGVPAQAVRRANQLRGSLPQVARAALEAVADGADSEAVTAVLQAFTLRVGQPIRPMLAASAPSIDAALAKISSAAIDWKIDGIRIQIHRQGPRVWVFTRTLDDITERVPEIVEIARALDVESAVIDGEAIALRQDERPYPFQVTSARAATQAGTPGAEAETARSVPLTPFLFDLLHIDGHDLIDLPAADRFAKLASVAPVSLLIPRIVTSDPAQAAEFFAGAIGRGHEGVVVKSVAAPYQTGRRGSDWIKVKPRTTLDLVILAVEWGHGRRTGLLSNLHLGARDPDTGKFVMLGKTFKGLTDKMLSWQTDHLLALADPPDQRSALPPGDSGQQWRYGTVRVRPELVAEIAFDGVQASKRYPGGVALRFARVIRYRTDKQPEEADTIETVRALWQAPTEA